MSYTLFVNSESTWDENWEGLAVMATRIGQLANPSTYLGSLLKILVSRPIPESEWVGLGWGSSMNTANSVPRWFCRALRAAVLYCPLTGVLWNVSLQGGSSIYGLDTITLHWLKLHLLGGCYCGGCLEAYLPNYSASHPHFLHSRVISGPGLRGKVGTDLIKRTNLEKGENRGRGQPKIL